MHANSGTSTGRLIARRLFLLPALVVGLSLAVAGGASAQAGGFQATVRGIVPKPKPCPNGDFLCGSATTNYGAATWTFNLTNLTPLSSQCDSYEATVTFALDDASNSTLVLGENGPVCGPGLSPSAPGALKSFGNPFYTTGSWTVETATGQFGSIALGTVGTEALHGAGAQASGTYATT